MIHSMTSFGRGEAALGEQTWVVEVKSVNHRFCDINVKMPRQYAALEERLKKKVAALYSRGHVDVYVTIQGQNSAEQLLEVNVPLARQYSQALRTLGEELAITVPADLALLAGYPNVIRECEMPVDLDLVWQALEKASGAALAEGVAMRRREGALLRQDLLARLDKFAAKVAVIEEEAPKVVERRAALLRQRLDALLNGPEVDPYRLAQEVAVLADKVDVSEELVRLRSHIAQFADFLDRDEPVGRRLDFLMQEFLREVNTMASKIGDAAITHITVELKNEAEQMREQVQNLE